MSEASRPGGRSRVLIVDGDRAGAAELESLLSPAFEVMVSRTGDKALELLRSHRIDVICFDDPVPGMDNVRFLQRALALPDPPCFLLITSAVEMRDKKLDGLSGVIVRPYEAKTLLDRVARLSRVAETRRRVQSARQSIHHHAEGGSSDE